MGGNMNENKFKTYLKDGQPFGDSVDLPFVNDAIDDHTLPDPASWEELENHIRHLNPDVTDDTLNAAKHVWQLFIKTG